MVSNVDDIANFDAIFWRIFGAAVGAPESGTLLRPTARSGLPSGKPSGLKPKLGEHQMVGAANSQPDASLLNRRRHQGDEIEGPSLPIVASDVEKLRAKSFISASDHEIQAMISMMKNMAKLVPTRNSRRNRSLSYPGDSIDLRASIRQARRSGGDIARFSYRRHQVKPRRIVALLDISGSMEPYARPYIAFLHGLSLHSPLEVFSFATRLTRLTRELNSKQVAIALSKVGRKAPDWSSGTRIGDSIGTFIRDYGRRGIARGAVVLIFSDGWEHGETRRLALEMERLSRLAYRIVWISPRNSSKSFRPSVGGLIAALPYCDEFVGGHNVNSLESLLARINRG